MPPNIVPDYTWSPTATGTLLEQTGVALANTTVAVEQDRWVLIVDEAILVSTVCGALIILGSMAYLEFKGRAATTRMRIVQSLVVSDLSLGIVGTIGVSKNLSPGGLHKGAACDGLGVMLVATIWSEHMWTLSLAVATYMILIYPLHSFTLWLEKRWYWLWLGVWVLAFGLAVMGYKIKQFVPSGGICYYPGGLFSELIQFIPRAIVFIVITILYVRLFVFLRRPDKIRSPYSDSPTYSDSYTNGRLSSSFPMGPLRKRGMRLPFFRSRHRRSADTKSGQYEVHIEGEREDGASPLREQDDIPPWEKVDLPVFQIDGQKYGGPSTNFSPTRPRKSRRPKTGGSISTPPTSYTRQFDDVNANIVDYGISPSALPTPIRETAPDGGPFEPTEGEPRSPPGYTYTSRHVPNRASTQLDPNIDTLMANDTRRGSATTQASSSQSGSNGTPTLPSSKVIQPQPSLSDRGSDAGDEHERDAQIDASPNPTASPRIRSHDEAGDDDDELDLMHVLKTTAPPRSQEDKFAPREGETVVLVEESMASYLNRKTALLMLWFPLGYILLFSVSLIRIIFDLAGTPPEVLRAISRWFIFAQGVLDAIIYGVVEWHTKRVVRKKVRKIGMSPTTSPAGQRADGSGSWVPGSLIPARKPNSPVLDQGNTIRLGSSQGTVQPHSMEMANSSTARRGSHFQTVSHTSSIDSQGTASTVRQHTPLERSILQELAPEIVGGRRDSKNPTKMSKPG